LHDRSNNDDDPIVLVIDDDPDVREGLGALLQSVNLQSTVFADTREFFRWKLPDKVSCLILDVRLPELSGLDLQTELAKVQIDSNNLYYGPRRHLNVSAGHEGWSG
jgi:FixJ family two-component response regulator